MRSIGGSLFLVGVVSAASAQTNAPMLVAYGASETPQRALSLEDAIAKAIQHNFDVRVERYEPVKSELSLDQAYAGWDPSFNVGGEHSHNSTGAVFSNGQFTSAQTTSEDSFNSSLTGLSPSGLQYALNGNVNKTTGNTFGINTNGTPGLIPFESSGGTVGVTLTQPLLKNMWIDSTRLNIILARSQIKQSQQGLRLQLITTVSAVENAYFELVFARENLIVTQQALDLAQTQLDQDRQRVAVGSLAPLDVQQDLAQVATSRANLIAAQFTLEQDENTLKNLITDSYTQWQPVHIEPTTSLEAVQQLFDLQDSWDKGLTERPDLLQAKLTLEQQGVQLKYDFNQLFPELDLKGTFGYNGAGVTFGDVFNEVDNQVGPFYSYGAQLTVPLANLHARSVYKFDKAVQQQNVLKLKQLEQTVMVQIDNAVKQAESAWESVGATKQARIYAEAALDAEQKKYAVGKSTTFTVLQLQNSLTTARSQEIRSLANYQQALTNLAQQEGSTLERRNVEVTVK